MKFDATRKTFNPGKNYSRVLMQQGRVQLDADWNEQSAIQLNYVRQLGADLIGPYGGPSSPGFRVNPLVIGGKPTTPADFVLTAGRYYVDGILCSNETTPVIVTGYPANPGGGNSIQVFTWTVDGNSFQTGQFVWLFDADPSKGLLPILLQVGGVDYVNRALMVSGDFSAYVKSAGTGAPQRHFIRHAPTYLTQRDFPAPPLSPDAGEYQVYLDVWERPITWAEDDSVREVALNGADTAARAKVIAQVKVMKPISANVCPTSYELAAVLQPANRGFLMARARPAQVSTDPCTISPDALYRGPENQLYRVEIHTGSLDPSGNPSGNPPTFKWSRENGSVVFPIAGGGGTNTLTLESLGRDDRFRLAEGDWVEVVDDDYVLQNRALPLMQVQSIDRARLRVVLSGTPDAAVGKDPAKHPLLRRWDHKAGDPALGGLTLAADNAALILPPAQVGMIRGQVVTNEIGFVIRAMVAGPRQSQWLELEDGVQVQFLLPPDSVPPAAQFRTGDYWLIPARVATGDVEWPRETVPNASGPVTTAPVPLPPDGITHHYAPLARLAFDNNFVTLLHDCTVTFDGVSTRPAASANPSPPPTPAPPPKPAPAPPPRPTPTPPPKPAPVPRPTPAPVPRPASAQAKPAPVLTPKAQAGPAPTPPSKKE
jgi:hypothetical protein